MGRHIDCRSITGVRLGRVPVSRCAGRLWVHKAATRIRPSTSVRYRFKLWCLRKHNDTPLFRVTVCVTDARIALLFWRVRPVSRVAARSSSGTPWRSETNPSRRSNCRTERKKCRDDKTRDDTPKDDR